jgi:branched-chain amino acid transport system permease protein
VSSDLTTTPARTMMSGASRSSRPQSQASGAIAFVRRHPSVALAGWFALVVLAPLVVSSNYWAFTISFAGVMAIGSLALNLLYGFGGVVSLGHGALVGVGAYSAGIMMTRYEQSFWVAVVVAMIISALFGGLMALPSMRLSRWYFALVSLALAEVISSLIREWGGLTGGFSGLLGIPLPSIGGHVLSDVQMMVLVFVFILIAYVVLRNLVRSRFGIGLVASRETEAAATSCGVNLFAVRLIAFMISAAFCGLAGALFAVQKAVLTPDDFTAILSINLVIAVVVGGAGHLSGPLLGGLAFFFVPSLLSWLDKWRMFTFACLLLVLVIFAPHGLAGMFRAVLARLPWKLTDGDEVLAGPVAPSALARPQSPPRRSGGGALVARGVAKSFGGVTALDGVDLDVRAGEVLAVVGPNGSGKTTLLNCISGTYSPDRGTVHVEGHDVTGKAPDRVARASLSRTFQTPQLMSTLSVLDNVRLGLNHTSRATNLELAFRVGRGRRENERANATAMSALEMLGMAELADKLPEEVPHGQQRLVEIARATVSLPAVLLLDEPAAGLTAQEMDELGVLLRRLADEQVAVVLVEHHVKLVHDVADRVVVLDQGLQLASGTADEVFSDPAVRRVYLGAS